MKDHHHRICQVTQEVTMVWTMCVHGEIKCTKIQLFSETKMKVCEAEKNAYGAFSPNKGAVAKKKNQGDFFRPLIAGLLLAANATSHSDDHQEANCSDLPGTTTTTTKSPLLRQQRLRRRRRRLPGRAHRPRGADAGGDAGDDEAARGQEQLAQHGGHGAAGDHHDEGLRQHVLRRRSAA